MAAELKEAFGVDAQLIAGGGGIFDVTVDGERIFCKDETDRFPEKREVVDILRKRNET